jgi:hypothetical protein
MSMYARLPRFDGVVRSIIAFVPDDVPHADVVNAALAQAEAEGSLLIRRHGETHADVPGDLMLIFAHGSGSGLTFRTGTAAQPLSVVQLATTLRARTALVASCWSLAPPPISFPMTLPAAMMLNGASSIIGGLWPLPTEPTARLVAAVVAGLARGRPLASALNEARTQSPEPLLAHWGLAVYGRA